MDTARLFTNGRSQAVRLPKAYRLPGDEVYVTRVGRGVLLLPKDAAWDLFDEALDEFSDDFMASREQPPLQTRDFDLDDTSEP